MTTISEKVNSIQKVLGREENFLGIEEPGLCSYENSKFVIQSVPYEHTSSYLAGSAKGPGAILEASHFVEFYDEELERETYKECGIATLEAIDFGNKVDAQAVELIEKTTEQLIHDEKFVVSLGAEHTVTLGFVKAFAKRFDNLTVLQIDAHSDLRQSYHNNPYSHASVMARIHELGISLCQVGIRAQCKEEADLIKTSSNIFTFYAHHIRKNPGWMSEVISSLTENIYITIDADGFDPSIVPAVGTAEPGGLYWRETMEFLKQVIEEKNVVGFDIVEIAPRKGDILSEYNMAKLTYRLIGYLVSKQH
jgi:N1-aminopropylagmatine ureohydrolase